MSLVFTIRIVQLFYYLNPKFQASGYLLFLYRQVFSQRGSDDVHHKIQIYSANDCLESFSRESARVMQYLSFSLFDVSVPDYDFFFAIITVCDTFLVKDTFWIA